VSLFEDTNPRALKELLGQIQNREAALPDFQRDFVWDPSATQELIVSIANNYPAGSLLRIRNTHDLFACREFQGAPELAGHRPTYLVLDGQQRLTSLYQAFYGLGDHRYFLDISQLLSGADFEEAVFHLRATHKRTRQLAQPDVQARELVLPLRVLRGGAGGFLHWSLAAAQLRGDQGLNFVNELSAAVGARWIQSIDDYHFPVVTLSDSTDATAVCTIFETLNRTGVRLSPFELLTARFWPQNLSLRSLWSKTTDKYPAIADFDVDPYYMLQTIALVSRQPPGCKRGEVLALEAPQVEGWWDRVAWAMNEAVTILREDCGVLVPRWIPYETMLIPMAGILARLAIPLGPEIGAARQKLVRWFWCSVFGQTYESAPNSRAAKDLPECLAWLAEGGPEPEAVAAFSFDPRILRDTTYRQRAMYRGAMALSLRKEPRDFYKGAVLTRDLILEEQVDDHHIFPQGYLAKAKPDVPARLRDCVLNRTLIDRKTNIKISDRPPSEYMPEIRVALGPERFAQLLQSHHLPAGPDSPLFTDDFDAFLTWRQEALWAEIQDVTGIHEASNLIDEAEEPAA
jgi:hypothetical protein